jgi:excisionase family DNA binding protein
MSTEIKRQQISTAGDILTLGEAAAYLRLSKSTLYQRRDIPRHRLPGSRTLRFIKEELTDWLTMGPAGLSSSAPVAPRSALDTEQKTIYHRSARYR